MCDTYPSTISVPTPSSPAAGSIRRVCRSWRPASPPTAFCSRSPSGSRAQSTSWWPASAAGGRRGSPGCGSYGLTERHARALLRLEDPEQRLAAVEHIGKNQLNVADAEGYIDRLVAQNQTTQPRRRSAYIIKDVRLFLNSVDRGVRLMQTAGVGAKVSRRDTEDAICLTVTIPRAKPQKDVS